MTTQQRSGSGSKWTEVLAEVLKDARPVIALVCAIVFNVVTATFTFAGMRALEGDHSWVVVPFCAALTVIKLLFEKEFCANIFARRPRKPFFTVVGFAFFFVVAAAFNFLNIVNTQKADRMAASAQDSKVRQWRDDSESVSKAVAKLRGAVAQEIGKVDAAKLAARGLANGGAELARLRQDSARLGRLDAAVKGIEALPVTMPERADEAARFLTAAVSGFRNTRAQLPEKAAAAVGEIQLTVPKAVESNVLAQAGDLWSKGMAQVGPAVGTAIFLELFAVFALLAGQDGLTLAERIEGWKLAAGETRRAVVRPTVQTAIPFAVAGRQERGTIVLSGSGPVSYAELVRAVDEASAFLPASAVAIYNWRGDLLDPDLDALPQLEGKDLLVEVRDK
jgi:hypothetical protein